MSTKRRNLTRWQANRLRRLEYKLDGYEVAAVKFSPFNDYSPGSIARCQKRARELRVTLRALTLPTP